MNKEIAIEKIKNYLSNKYNCNKEIFEETGVHFITNNENKLQVLSFYDSILVNCNKNVIDKLQNDLKEKTYKNTTLKI